MSEVWRGPDPLYERSVCCVLFVLLVWKVKAAVVPTVIEIEAVGNMQVTHASSDVPGGQGPQVFLGMILNDKAREDFVK